MENCKIKYVQMKKNIFFLLLLGPFFNYGQTCFSLKQGQKVKVSIKSYIPNRQYQPDYKNLKESEKDIEVDKYNEKVTSGKEISASEGVYDCVVKTLKDTTKGQKMTMFLNIAGTDYPYNFFCRNDTMFLYRNMGIKFAFDSEKKPTGYTLQGPQVIPNNLKVGDRLKPYEDFSQTTDTNSFSTLYKRLVLIDWKAPGTTSIFTSGYVTSLVKTSISMGFHWIHFQNAFITGTEEVKISGKTYTAYKIESEDWTKNSTDFSSLSQDKKSAVELQEIFNKAVEKNAKKMARKGLTNKEGYTVSYKTDWFIPHLGIYKTMAYDSDGFCNMIAYYISIE